jgi:hypothetical protein
MSLLCRFADVQVYFPLLRSKIDNFSIEWKSNSKER